MKSLLFLSVVTLLTVHKITSQEVKSNLSQISRAYMKEYSSWNIDGMSKFHHDSIHFQDPTALDVFQTDYDRVGKEEVAKLLKGVFNGSFPKHIAFNISNLFVSGSYVVVNSNYELVLPSAWYDESKNGRIFISIPIMTVLKFAGNKIISHTDYADYKSYNRQIKIQLKQG